MFTPEFVNEERGEFLLVANHSLESSESIQLSIAFNLARISYGRKRRLSTVWQILIFLRG